MESGGSRRSSAGGGDCSKSAVASSSGTNSSRGSTSRSSGSRSSVSGGGIIVSTSGGGGAAPLPSSDWEMFQFGKYSMDILEMLSGHQAHQFKGLGLERQLQHQQHAQLQHQQQLQQQAPPGEASGPLLSGLGLGALQGSRSNAFADSSSIFAKMSAPPAPLPQHTQSSAQSSRKSSKMTGSGGSAGSATGYPQFLRPFHPAEAALAQEQLHPGLGRFEHFSSGSSSGVVTSPPPPLHPGLSVPQASPGQPSSSPSSSTSASTSNNPSSCSSVASLGQQLTGAQSDARSLHQQFSCMLAANQYFLSGVPPNASLEQFLVQQGTHNHLGLGQGGDSNSGIAPPPLHSSHSHGHLTPQQQQQQMPPHALSHPHPHHPLHSAPQPPSLGSFDFQGIPVLSSNQIASLMQQESGLPLPLPLHLSLPKDEGKESGVVSGSGGGRRKKAMVGYQPQRKSDISSSSSSCHSSGDTNSSGNVGGHSLEGTSSLGGGGRVGMTDLGGDSSSLISSSQTPTSTVSSSSSTAPSCTSASVLVTNCSQLPKTESQGTLAPIPSQPEPEPLYHCGECGKTFTHLSSLRRHLRSHGAGGGSSSNNITNLNPNQNSNLPCSTQDSTSQSDHHQSQPQQDSSVCTQPQQANPAPTSSSCPSPEKTHCCPECGKGFKKRGHLLQHRVIHSGARPFACPICQRSFNRRESLTRHEKIHEEKPYRCPACGRCFRESTSLLNHAASGTCGKPGRRSRSKRNNSCNSSGAEGQKSQGRVARGTGILANGSGVAEYQGASLGDGGASYGKAEGGGVAGCVMGVNEERDSKVSLTCQGLFQQGRGVNSNSGCKTEGKYGDEFSRNCFQAAYRGDDYHAEYKLQRSQTSPCYPNDPPCGNGMAGPTLRKAPLAPTLHPHPQSQTQQQQPHLPLSSLLEDSEDDVTSSVSSAMSAIAAVAAASCSSGEINNSGGRGEERRDVIGGLLGGLGFGSVGASPGEPSSTSSMNKSYRGQGGNVECCDTAVTQSKQNQQQNNQSTPNAKPKRPRKPRPKKEPRTGAGASGEVKRRRTTQSGAGTNGEGKERPFLCSVCGRGFSRRETLRRHDRVHTGEKPYHCDVCGKDFREAFHLTKHRTVHSGEKNYKCELCGKEFGYAQSLKRHGKLHQKGEFGDAGVKAGVASNSGTMPGVSANQDGEQGNSESLYAQDKTPGSNVQPPPRLYTCAICWKSFRHHFHLTAHQQAVHEGGDKLFCCEVCGKAFAYANSLSRHRLSQHGLSRTGQTHQARGDSTSCVRESPGGTGSVTDGRQATSALQLGPPDVAQGGQQSDVSPAQHPPHPPAQTGYSLFYPPETGSTHSMTSARPHSHPLQTHSSHSVLSHHQQPPGIKGAPVYPSGPNNALNLTSSATYQPLSQQYSQSQHHLIESPHLEKHKLYSQGNIHKSKKKKKGKKYQVYQSNRGEFSVKPLSAIERQGKWTGQQKRKIRIRVKLFQRKRKLAQLLRARGGKTRHGRLRVGHLSSLDVLEKQFFCPLCPCTAFSRRAAFLVHYAARHNRSISRQARMQCFICRKQFRKLLAALRHRGFHLAQGSFCCTQCPSRFWNGSLLERHRAVCQGVRRCVDWEVKSKTAMKTWK